MVLSLLSQMRMEFQGLQLLRQSLQDLEQHGMVLCALSLLYVV